MISQAATTNVVLLRVVRSFCRSGPGIFVLFVSFVAYRLLRSKRKDLAEGQFKKKRREFSFVPCVSTGFAEASREEPEEAEEPEVVFEEPEFTSTPFYREIPGFSVIQA